MVILLFYDRKLLLFIIFFLFVVNGGNFLKSCSPPTLYVIAVGGHSICVSFTGHSTCQVNRVTFHQISKQKSDTATLFRKWYIVASLD